MAAKVCIALIRFYQLVFSGWVGWQCRFIPTCSNYAIEAFQRFGAIRGLWLTAARLCRCHPWAARGMILCLRRSAGGAGSIGTTELSALFIQDFIR